MADDGVLQVENRGAVRIVRLNRPDKLNALDTSLITALREALLVADRTPAVRALVLAGNGRGFCAGADLGEFKEPTPANQVLVLRRAELSSRLYALLQELDKPIVAAAHGVAVGGGAGLAIGCDMLVAATGLRFGYPEMRHSAVPALVMASLQRNLGRKLAFELASTGRILGAEEMLSLGVANRVVAPASVLDAAMEIATCWAAATPQAMVATKSLFYQSADLPFSGAMQAGRDVDALMRVTAQT